MKEKTRPPTETFDIYEYQCQEEFCNHFYYVRADKHGRTDYCPNCGGNDTAEYIRMLTTKG